MAKECYSIQKLQNLIASMLSKQQEYSTEHQYKVMNTLKFIVKRPLGYFQISLIIINYWIKGKK